MIGISLLVEAGLYLGWTSVGGTIIEGIQGRYFLPIATILPICFVNKKFNK